VAVWLTARGEGNEVRKECVSDAQCLGVDIDRDGDGKGPEVRVFE